MPDIGRSIRCGNAIDFEASARFGCSNVLRKTVCPPRVDRLDPPEQPSDHKCTVGHLQQRGGHTTLRCTAGQVTFLAVWPQASTALRLSRREHRIN